jgi:starch-binding outer membrane protein SusE/F
MLLQLNPRRTYNMEARISSTITGGSGKLTSNVFAFTVRPFPPPPKVAVPTAGTLWITGDAVASGWSNPLPPPYNVSQRFTKLPSNTDYELLVNMNATGSYKLIQTPGDWSTQYHMVTGGTALAGSFEYGDANPAFPAPSIAGLYKLSFNFQLGTYTVVKQ